MSAIYIHIPFCKQACHYCDFHFSTNLRPQSAMLQAIAQELQLRKHYLGDVPVTSIYVGGGTPSLLDSAALASLFDTIAQHFVLSAHLEITLEANPDDVTWVKLQSWRKIGINRLSIGIQTFQDTLLRAVNRAHNSQEAIQSVALAQKAGFDNLSIDLMYAIPGMTPTMWEADLVQAMQLQPTHISAYCMTIAQNTVFGRWQQKGKLKAVAETIAAQQFETLVQVLSANHYEHYEVANFCQYERYAKHNTNYWKQGSYLGVGPGAHSYNVTTRQHNIAHNQRYMARIQQGSLPSTVEVLSRQDHINEYIMTRLRTKWGCDLDHLRTQYNYDLQKVAEKYLAQLYMRQLATLRGAHLVLTHQGKLLADQITADLFVA